MLRIKIRQRNKGNESEVQSGPICMITHKSIIIYLQGKMLSCPKKANPFFFFTKDCIILIERRRAVVSLVKWSARAMSDSSKLSATLCGLGNLTIGSQSLSRAGSKRPSLWSVSPSVESQQLGEQDSRVRPLE